MGKKTNPVHSESIREEEPSSHFRRQGRALPHRAVYLLSLAIFATPLLFINPADAGGLRFQFVNPSFGGDPLNSAHLLGLADRENRFTGSNDAPNFLDPAEQFVRQLQSRLLSGVANQVANAIFGEDRQDTGFIKYGDQEISWSGATTDSITLVIQNTATGASTEIVIPQFNF
jgi:curli production assembly/transport component CsgF